MCWSDTASIYCLYLLGSLSPAVRLHSLAYSSFEVTGKMLLTFFLWFLLLSWGGQNKKDVKSYDWSLGLLCLFYQIGCVFQKKKHSVLSVHSYCVLIVCMCFTKPVHSQTRKPTCSHPSSKIAHSLKTNIINCDSLKQKQKKNGIQLLYPNIYSSPEWPASLTNTHTNSSGYYLSCSI